jgi:hypothetical protein
MSVALIGAGYAAIGLALTVGALVLGGRKLVAGDVVMLLLLWPLAAPHVFTRPPASADDEPELVSALARASASPLASVLPDAETARMLQTRLHEANDRLGELEAVLARPDFDPVAAAQRARELAARGATAAANTAQLRVRTLGQLRALRERYRAELEEVRELIAQLVTQAELVRLQPSIAHASSELVRELVARVEGLDDLFAYQTALEAVPE